MYVCNYLYYVFLLFVFICKLAAIHSLDRDGSILINNLSSPSPLQFKAASSHKGSNDFDQLINCQDLSGEHMGAIWTMRFSHCGRLLVRTW